MKTIIISDIHFGGPRCDTGALRSFLYSLDCDHLIIAGDFFELWECSHAELSKSCGAIRALVRQLRSNGVKITYLLGNHDRSYISNPLLSIWELPVVPMVEVKMENGMRVAVVHGHEFDRLMLWYYPLYRLSALLRNWLERRIGYVNTHRSQDSVSSFRKHEKYGKLTQRIRNAARRTYGRMGYDVIVMGHLHKPEHVRGDGMIEYVNAGDWKGSNTFVEIEGDTIKLMHYE